MTAPAIGPADVRAAAAVLAGVAHRTPVVTSRTLDERCGASVVLKCENLQRTGSFKFRGAYHAVSRAGGDVLAYSSGNHAQAVALAARLLGVRATIVMPHDAPPQKVAATVGYGAEVVRYDRYREDREAIGRERAEQRGLALVPPFDHPHVMAGQGTAALELLEETGPLDALVVCVGGGGLISGCATITSELAPGCRVVGVEPEAGDDVRRSLAEGHIVRIDVPRTIADGAQTQAPGRLTFPIIRELVDRVVTVDDAALVRAVRFAAERLKLVVEPTGALGLAALLEGAVDVRGRRVGVILSGGNLDLSLLGHEVTRDVAS